MIPEYVSTSVTLLDWIQEYNSIVHEQAVKYIKENSDLINTNIDEFIIMCPESCKHEVERMLFKAGIEFSDMSLKTWEKFIFDTKSKDYMKNTCKWITIDTIPEVEETL
jgi:hypothetical protein